MHMEQPTITEEKREGTQIDYILLFAEAAPEISKILEISQVKFLINSGTNYYLSKVNGEPEKIRLSVYFNRPLVFDEN